MATFTPKKPLSFYDYLLQRGVTEKEVLAWRAIPPGLYTDLPPTDKLPRLAFPRPDLGPSVEDVMYAPTRVQRLFHNTKKENCLLEGPRGTGKSLGIRFDAHLWSLQVPGWKYLVLRRKLTDLKKNHLLFMPGEMEKLGGRFNRTDNIAYYKNGSVGFFSYCERLADVENLLSSDFGAIYFDEWTTFPWELTTRISASARLSEEMEIELGITAFVKGGTNPIGVGANKVKQYFIDKSVPAEDDAEYDPEDWEAIRTTRDDNPYLNWAKYDKRLSRQPERVRAAWRDGIWVSEGAFFTEFRPDKGGVPWHVIKELPSLHGKSVLSEPWVNIYRAFDWGFRPDPAVCLWIAVLPNKHAIVFKERHWRETIAEHVRDDIKRESEGMRIVDTFSDPSVFSKRGETRFSIGEIMESGGVPLTPSVNDRSLFGEAICNFLNSRITESVPTEEGGISVTAEYPRLQILSGENSYRGGLGCPNLIRTFPEIQTDSKDNRKLAEGEDHYVVSLAYFCIGDAPPSRDPEKPIRPRWMLTRRQFSRSFSTRL